MIRILLALLPPTFRRRYGSEMAQVFGQRVREARGRGVGPWFGVWCRTVPDLVRTLALEWSRAPGWSGWVADLRFGARGLARRPLFAAALVATVAVGVGANTAVFSAVHAVLLEPLPVRDPASLVRVWSHNAEAGQDRFLISPADLDVLMAEVEAAEGLAGWFATEATILQGARETSRRIRTLGVTAELFRVVGVEPALGRVFAAADGVGREGGNDVVLLTHGGWERLFAADPEAVGRTVAFANGAVSSVVGVLPGGLEWLVGDADAVFPFVGLPVQPSYTDRWLSVVARRGAGVDAGAFDAALEAAYEGVRRADPERARGWSFRTDPLHAVVVGDVGPLLWTLLGGAGLVLLVVCANVAGLLVGRAEERRGEVALRAALGAGRGRIARQVLSEAALLAGVAGVLGLGLGALTLRGLVALGRDQVPRLAGASLSGPVLAFSVLVVAVTALAAGVAPAVRLSRVAPGPILGESPRGVGRGRREGLRSTCLTVQLAVSTTLVVGAVLLVAHLRTLVTLDPGFDDAGVVAAEVSLPPVRYPEPHEVARFLGAVREAAAELPGVKTVGLTSQVPFGPAVDYPAPIRREGEAATDVLPRRPWFRQVDEGFFATLGVEVVEGRGFVAGDDADAPGVVVVNRSAARMLWPGEPAVGRVLEGAGQLFGPLGVMLHDRVRVVGVVDDLRYRHLAVDAEPAVYFPFRQAPFRRMSVVLRADDEEAAAALAGLERIVTRLDPSLDLGAVGPLAEGRTASLARERLATLLFGGFALLALGLAVLGLYGVTRQAVDRRRGEMGVRRALGADGPSLVRAVLGRIVRLVALGSAWGALAAWFLGPRVVARLPGVPEVQPWILVSAVGLLAVTALFAGLVPALRAARVAPAECLRAE